MFADDYLEQVRFATSCVLQASVQLRAANEKNAQLQSELLQLHSKLKNTSEFDSQYTLKNV